MDESKRYYWLKLKEDFFNTDTIAWLEEQETGSAYVLFYLKLCLLALKDNGVLIRHVGKLSIPYDVKKLSDVTRTDVNTAAVALEVFEKIGLTEKSEDGAIRLPELVTMVGSESLAAKRKREQRKKISVKSGTIVEQKWDIVPQSIEYRDKSIEYRERDKSIEIDNTHADTYISQQNAMFEKFWEEYPRKVGKAEARIAWAGLEVDEKLNQTILNAVQRYKKTNQWQNTTYIPYPVNFLQNERYNDDIPEDNDSVETLEDIAKRLYGSGDE